MPWPRPRLVFAASPDGLPTTGAAGPCVAVLPDGDLLAMAGALGRPWVRGVVAAEGLPPEEVRRRARLALPATARRPLHPLLSPDAALHHFEVDGYGSKAAVVAAVSLLAGARGLRRRAREALEQATDELLLNALFDAPTGPDGQPRYRHCPPEERARVTLPPGDRARLRCGGDGDRFVVAVRDRFGALRRATVLHHLARCAAAQRARRDPLEHHPGGAGVGLFLVAESASELLFRLRRGRLSEVVYAVSARPGPLRLQALFFDDEGDGAESGPGAAEP